MKTVSDHGFNLNLLCSDILVKCALGNMKGYYNRLVQCHFTITHSFVAHLTQYTWLNYCFYLDKCNKVSQIYREKPANL